MDKKKIIKSILGWAVACLIIYILFRTIYGNWDEIKNWSWQIDWIYLVLSILFLSGAYLTASQSWRVIIAGFGHNVRLSEAFRVIYLAQLGRYIPGKIWQVVGMVSLAKEVGVPAGVSMASFALVQAYALPAAFLIILATMHNTAWLESLQIVQNLFYIIIAMIIIIFLILFFKPTGLEWALNKILKLFRKEAVTYRPSIINRLSIFGLYLITWILFGISFSFFLKALIANSDIGFFYSVGAYITAYNIGYIVFFSPGGLGVREGVMTTLLGTALSNPVAASLAIINRIWITIAEALISLLALATYKFKR